MNYIRVHAGGITLGTGGVQESQVSILWNCGLWAHHVVKSRKVGDICSIMLARHVRGESEGHAGNSIGTKGEGRREPFSCSLNEADQ